MFVHIPFAPWEPRNELTEQNVKQLAFEVANPPGLILEKSGKNMKIYHTKMLSGFLK